MIKSIHHTGISVSNMENSLKFYRDLIGMKVVHDVIVSGKEIGEVNNLPNDTKVRIVILEFNGIQIELLEFLSPRGKPLAPKIRLCDNLITHIAFEVNDIDEVYNQWVAKGISFNSPPRAMRGGKGNTCAFLYDPDGVALEILQRPE